MEEQHGLAHAAETWRELATPREQVALISICDVAVRTGGGVTAEAMHVAATLMVVGLLADHQIGSYVAGLIVGGAMHEARQRAGLPGVRS